MNYNNKGYLINITPKMDKFLHWFTGFSDGVPQYEEQQSMYSFTIGKCMEDCTFDVNGKVEAIYGYIYCG